MQSDITGAAMDRTIERSKLRYAKWVVLAGAIVALFAWAYRQASAPASMSYNVDKLSISPVQVLPFENKISVTATSRPKDIRVINTRVAGRVKELFAKNGDLVEEGQLLFSLESFDHEEAVLDRKNRIQSKLGDLQNQRITLENQLMDRQSKMARDKYDLKELEQNYIRKKKGNQTGDVSSAQLGEVKARFELKKELYELAVKQQKNYDASYKLRLKQLELSEENIDREMEIANRLADALNVRATTSGRLSGLKKEIGENVAKGAKVAEVHSADEVLLEANISENYINDVKEGLKAKVKFNDQEYDMLVGVVDPDIESGSFSIELFFNGAIPEGLGNGRTLDTSIFLSETQDAMVVNYGPYLRETGGRWIFVLSPDGQSAERREVDLGRHNYRYVEVTSGVTKR